MRAAGIFAALAVSVFLSFPLQETIPPVAGFHGARVLLAPMLFCYGALALPFPLMLALAAATGFLSDLAFLNPVGGHVEIGLGWSIFYFVIFGSIAHGLQPAFLRGHWWIHIPASVFGTSLFLALQFAMISVRREGFFFGEVAAWRIVGSGLMAGLAAPLVSLIAWLAGRLSQEAPGRRNAKTPLRP